MIIEALQKGKAQTYGIKVKGKLEELQKLQGDPRVLLVDVLEEPRRVLRPIQSTVVEK